MRSGDRERDHNLLYCHYQRIRLEVHEVTVIHSPDIGQFKRG